MEFWRHLVESLAVVEKVNPKAVQLAWTGLNERVLQPEKLEILAKSFAKMGDIEKARRLCSDVEWTVPKITLCEQSFPECKLPLSDVTPNGYASMLLRLHDSVVSGQKGKIESLFAPIIFTFDHSIIANSSQLDSMPQSSQEASQMNSPAKKRRPVRQIARRRSQDLDKIVAKVSLSDVLCELFPTDIGQWWSTIQNVPQLKTHLIRMNEQKASLMTRIVEYCKESLEHISYANIKKLLILAVEEMKCRDDDVMRRCVSFIPLSLHEIIPNHPILPDNELASSMISTFKSFSDIQTLIDRQEIAAAKSSIDKIDYKSCLYNDDIHGELKDVILRVCARLEIPIDYELLLEKYGDQFWLPMEVVALKCSRIDPVLAAKLLLMYTELPAPVLFVNILKCSQAQSMIEKMLDYLDQNSLLLANDGVLACEIIKVCKSEYYEITWNLFRAMYRLPTALNINAKFSSDASFTKPPSLEHITDIFSLIERFWNEQDEKMNLSECESLLQWLLSNLQLPNIVTRIIELNGNSLKHSLRTFTQDLQILAPPKFTQLPEIREVSLYKSITNLLYQIQSEQFVNKRRSPDWLHSYNSTLKLHWSLTNDPQVMSDLGLCFHALCKYSVTSFEAASLSKLLPKLKRKLKKSLICFQFSDSQLIERVEVLELILQPGLLQFQLIDQVRKSLLSKYIELLNVALERGGEWRWWYLLAEAMYSVDPTAALTPLRSAFCLCKNDTEAQCLVLQLYLKCTNNVTDKMQARMEELERTNSYHRLVYAKFLCSIDSASEQELALSLLLPFLAKPRVSGLASFKQSTHDRPGDYYHHQELYVMSAINYYRSNPQMLLQIAQRVKTCGTNYLLSPDHAIMACAEHASIIAELSVDDKKKMLSFLRDMPKSDRRDMIVSRLS